MKVYLKIILALVVIIYILKGYNLLTSKTVINEGCSQKYANFFIKEKAPRNSKLTFCKNWNKDKITLSSSLINIQNNNYLTFDYIGFPKDKNISYYIEDKNKNRYYIKGLQNSSEHWLNKTIKIPKLFKDKIVLKVEDLSVDKYGWAGIGNIKIHNNKFLNKIPLFINILENLIILTIILAIYFKLFRLIDK